MGVDDWVGDVLAGEDTTVAAGRSPELQAVINDTATRAQVKKVERRVTVEW